MQLFDREPKAPSPSDNPLFVCFADDTGPIVPPELPYLDVVVATDYTQLLGTIGTGTVNIIRDNVTWVEKLRLVVDNPSAFECTVIYVDGVIDYGPSIDAEVVVSMLSRTSYNDWAEAKAEAERVANLAEREKLSPDELSRRVNQRADGSYKMPKIDREEEDLTVAEEQPPVL